MSLVIFLLVFLLFFSRIKKHIWPNVPDPSKSVIAQWSPQTPAKVKGKQKTKLDYKLINKNITKEWERQFSRCGILP